MNYEEFLKQKEITDKSTGFCPVEINPLLFDFQKVLVTWACKRGRAAIFADCGLGKTFIQLEWAKQIPGRVIIIAPLAVTYQTVREAEKLGINVSLAKDSESATGKIVIANYESIHKIDVSKFDGVVLDESSILKSYMGKTKRLLIDLFKNHKYKLACTATPAPNDHLELGNHAEFLGIMPSNEMISRWFINDTMQAGNYRLKHHGKNDFWKWVSSWAVSMRYPTDIGDFSNDGYILPKLNITTKTIEAPAPEGMLFHIGGSLSATDIHRAKRSSAVDRGKEVARFEAESQEQCLIWCDTDYEADAIKKHIPNAAEVRGSMPDKTKEELLIGFANGSIKTLITKPSIAGFGMNFQKCHRVAFVGLSYSFENLYQSLRRVYRFGQQSEIECLIVEAESEQGIRDVVQRKIAQYEEMQSEMCLNMKDFQLNTSRKLSMPTAPVKENGNGWELWRGDCVETLRGIEDNSIGLTITSPPFANLYIYSDSIADMGNSDNYNQFFEHFSFLIKELYRTTINGRLCAIHCKDLPAYKGRDGFAGLVDFPGEIIKAFQDSGWKYHSRVTIWKDPVIEMQRTKNHGLLHKQLCKDSCASRMGMADFLLAFRKWDDDEFREPVKGESKEVRFDYYVGENNPENITSKRDMSIQVWQRYASPVWFDINQMRVLQGKKDAINENDEKHICPLQLDVIERAIHLWSNEGDVVFDPFSGIGSTVYSAVSMGRYGIGIELKESYWKQSIKNLQNLEEKEKQAVLL